MLQTSPFGISNHDTIVLLPTYKQKIKQNKPIEKDVKFWNSDTEDHIEDIFS